MRFVTWRVLSISGRHDTGCRMIQERRVKTACEDVASTIHQSLPKLEMPTHEQLNSPTMYTVVPLGPSAGMKSPVHSSGSGSPVRFIAVSSLGKGLVANQIGG